MSIEEGEKTLNGGVRDGEFASFQSARTSLVSQLAIKEIVI